MAKRPTPKKKLSNDRGNRRYAAYVGRQHLRLLNQMNSPFNHIAEKPVNTKRALEKITKIKA